MADDRVERLNQMLWQRFWERQMLAEARASVALDNDPRAETICLEDLTPEVRARYEKE